MHTPSTQKSQMFSDGSLPLPLPVLDTEALRRELAGLADPHARTTSKSEGKDITDLAIRFCSILAHLFGDSLNRKTLWERIGSGFATALARVQDDDCERFVTECLDHIKADAGKSAACDALVQVITTMESRPAEWRHGFLTYLRSHSYAVLAHGRARWEQVKAREIEL